MVAFAGLWPHLVDDNNGGRRIGRHRPANRVHGRTRLENLLHLRSNTAGGDW